MGTTLTGTTPQDTYDSLIKVTDNGPIGATAKLLTDGLGNDSVLYLGTAGLGIKATSVLSFNVNDATHSVGYDSVIDGSQLRGQNGVRFSTGSGGGTERMRITADGLVGIGTSSPSSFSVLSLAKNGVSEYASVSCSNSSSTATLFVGVGGSAVGATALRNNAYVMNVAASDLILGTSDFERCRILAAGGLTFNGDTAQANALDDYEEGTFTPTLSFGGASTGITYSNQVGVYTKIGKVVTVRWGFFLSSKGSATGTARVSGLPFTIESLAYGDATGACSYSALSAAVTSAVVAVGGNGSTELYLRRFELGNETGLNDGNFNNNSYVYGTFVYTVA